VRLISFLGLVCAALLFFSTCWSSNSGPSGPVSKIHFAEVGFLAWSLVAPSFLRQAQTVEMAFQPNLPQ